MYKLDKIDRQILRLLQKDASISITDLAEKVNLTTTPCWRRIHRLEELKIISNRVVLVDANKVDLSLIGFVRIKTSDHSEQWYHKFSKTIIDFPEVTAFYRMAGEYDYLMQVRVKDIHTFDIFYKKLVREVEGLTDVTSTFAMEELKYTYELPI
ncbi:MULTISPECIES: Lrp/AsnC family transcriptional regulator [Pasteurellaceae]|uniref:Lrp/AsnC family transcriptional regulator n=1 Tax=Pasteurella atlantica TaxID=2827233 RepID=A0AAW8CJ73_9PAST|nr:Lrp/AsnC family transcriptional regulator [Pasteurella atlantica]MBR0573136.1 Lrp/AsnC family transcriptional regulator [Pasteurella atlantica]MDP8039007.1 Lrp/AsnC family transcriptional regulator [Pasteurella atlantica]MDP8041097.1 Lrp/AsnC family transcriptional regulator [Pasteurella atlantica]MDP8043290.1 Lrp/AsnC family transcriptional regulator [Pasteurella atlantica]MDP8045376.1 Lrp/AsnC family transcriptional regulator [Pasteurella atlantica]